MVITTCYSSVLEQSTDLVWRLIRDFNNYPRYIEGVSESEIEDGLRGDEVGAVRRFNYCGSWIRQRLADHSNEARSLTYEGVDPFVYPPGIVEFTPSAAPYEGTIRLLPVIDGDRTFIECSVSIDADPSDHDAWQQLLDGLIPDWTNSLRRTLAQDT